MPSEDIFQKSRQHIKTFRHTKLEEFFTSRRNVRGSHPGTRKMIPDGCLDLYKGMKSLEMTDFFLVIYSSLKDNYQFDPKQDQCIVGFTRRM